MSAVKAAAWGVAWLVPEKEKPPASMLVPGALISGLSLPVSGSTKGDVLAMVSLASS